MIESNEQELNIISKNCQYLYEKTRKAKERIHQERTLIDLLKKKIKETKIKIQQADVNRSHVNDKLQQLKQCSNYNEGK